MPAKRGNEKATAAAIAIQRHFRGYLGRQRYAKEVLERERGKYRKAKKTVPKTKIPLKESVNRPSQTFYDSLNGPIPMDEEDEHVVVLKAHKHNVSKQESKPFHFNSNSNPNISERIHNIRSSKSNSVVLSTDSLVGGDEYGGDSHYLAAIEEADESLRDSLTAPKALPQRQPFHLNRAGEFGSGDEYDVMDSLEAPVLRVSKHKVVIPSRSSADSLSPASPLPLHKPQQFRPQDQPVGSVASPPSTRTAPTEIRKPSAIDQVKELYARQAAPLFPQNSPPRENVTERIANNPSALGLQPVRSSPLDAVNGAMVGRAAGAERSEGRAAIMNRPPSQPRANPSTGVAQPSGIPRPGRISSNHSAPVANPQQSTPAVQPGPTRAPAQEARSRPSAAASGASLPVNTVQSAAPQYAPQFDEIAATKPARGGPPPLPAQMQRPSQGPLTEKVASGATPNKLKSKAVRQSDELERQLLAELALLDQKAARIGRGAVPVTDAPAPTGAPAKNAEQPRDVREQERRSKRVVAEDDGRRKEKMAFGWGARDFRKPVAANSTPNPAPTSAPSSSSSSIPKGKPKAQSGPSGDAAAAAAAAAAVNPQRIVQEWKAAAERDTQSVASGVGGGNSVHQNSSILSAAGAGGGGGYLSGFQRKQQVQRSRSASKGRGGAGDQSDAISDGPRGLRHAAAVLAYNRAAPPLAIDLLIQETVSLPPINPTPAPAPMGHPLDAQVSRRVASRHSTRSAPAQY